MEVNCWTWMWSCVAQHHSTLNRAGPPPSSQQSTARVVVGTCLWSAAIWLEPEARNWNTSMERLGQSSCPTLRPGIRITHSLHFAPNWDEMKAERHPWQLWTPEPWLTSGQGWTVLCADDTQPSHPTVSTVRALCAAPAWAHLSLKTDKMPPPDMRSS